MNEPLLQISSVFLFLTTAALVTRVWRAAAEASPTGIVAPNRFLSAAVASLVSTGACVAIFGADRVVLAAAFGVGVVVSAVDPAAAVCFLVANLLMRPWETGPSAQSLSFIPKVLALLCLGSWIYNGVRLKTFSILWNVPTRIFLGLALWILLAAAASGDMSKGLGQYFETVFVSAIVFILVSNGIRSAKELDLLRRILVIAVTGVISVAIYRTLAATGWSLDFSRSRLEGPGLTGNANDLAALIVLVMPLALIPASFGTVLCVLILLAGLVLSQSRGAFMALGIAGAAYSLVRARDKRVALLVSGVFLFLTLGGISVLSMTRNSADVSGSNQSRFSFLLAGLNMAIHNPLLGVGFNNFPKFFESYVTGGTAEWGERTAHSSWVLVLAETGFPGLALFGSLFVSVIRRSWRFRASMPALFVSMVGYGVSMTFLSHTYTLFPYLLFAVVLAAARIHSASALAMLIALGLGSSTAPAWAGIEAVSGGEKPVGSTAPAAEPRLHLKGSRGEVLNFLVKSALPGCVEWKLEGFKSTAPEARLFYMPSIEITQPSFRGAPLGAQYDPLVPVPRGKLCPDQTHGSWYWGELEIPEGMAPGKYTGTLRLGNERLPIELKVWKMKMPSQPALVGYSELSPWYATLGHHGKWHEGEEKLAALYFREMARHRMIPIKSFLAHPGVVRQGQSVSLDLTRKPVPDQSYSAVYLKDRPKWAFFDFPTVPPEKIDSPETRDYFRAIEASLGALGREGKALVYLWDEPDPRAFQALLRLARIAKENAPHLKILVTTPYKKELEKYVDIFVPVMDQFDYQDYPSPQEYEKLRKKGGDFWLYVSCMSHGCDALADSGTPDLSIERPASYVRSIGWLLSRYHAEAFLYYMANYAYQFYPKRDPWKSLWDFSGNGDGTLFYPGRKGERGFTSETPVASIRLKLWRESSYDADYIAWMEKSHSRPEWWSREFSSLVTHPRRWEKDYRKYQLLRDRIGDFLDSEASR